MCGAPTLITIGERLFDHAEDTPTRSISFEHAPAWKVESAGNGWSAGPAAARTARELGFPVVMGAPNVLRGESHSGNVSAAALVELGLVDALASDYLPSGLLAGAFTLACARVTTLPAAIGLVTEGAAAAAGLSDRGKLAPGLRADLALVDDSAAWPVVRATFRAA